MSTFLTVLATLVVIGLVYSVGIIIPAMIKRKREKSQAILKVPELIDKLAAATEPLAALPKLVEGLIAVTKEQVGELIALQEITRRYGLRAKSGDSYQPYDEEAAAEEAEIQELEQRGMSRTDAEERIRSARHYKNFRIVR